MDIEESNECSEDNARARNYCKRTCNLCISNAVTEKGKKCRISYLALHRTIKVRAPICCALIT